MICLSIAFAGAGCFAIHQDPIPQSNEGWSTRAERALRDGKGDTAIQELDEAIKGQPDNAILHIIRGSLKFRTGKITESVVDFDRSVQLEPALQAELWQRGIALYYLEKYQEGLDQFAIHRQVNPNDVENAFWHFMCNAKIKGVEEAKKDVLLAGFDQRVPLMQVQQLIQGKGSIDDVVAACEKGGAGPQGQRLSRFYGYLYLGLYYDVLNDSENAKKYLEKCVAQNVPVYMNDVAKIHLEILKKKSAKK